MLFNGTHVCTFIFLVSIKIIYKDKIFYIYSLLVYYFKIRVNRIIYTVLSRTLLERFTYRVKFIDYYFSRFSMSRTDDYVFM